jgi:hypothetical protein
VDPIAARQLFQDRIQIERAFLVLLDGDLVAAAMLSRLLDLYTRGCPDCPEVRPVRVRGGQELGWPLPWSWWRAELGVAERTGRRALARLRGLHLVYTSRQQARAGRVSCLIWTAGLVQIERVLSVEKPLRACEVLQRQPAKMAGLSARSNGRLNNR